MVVSSFDGVFDVVLPQGVEVLASTVNFGFFSGTQGRVAVASTFGFNHEIDPLATVDFLDISPVRVVTAQGGINLEFGG